MQYSKFNPLILLILLASLLWLFRANPTPTYNPFDNVFQVRMSKLHADVCDTISAGCGYYNLVHWNRDFAMYYQIYNPDWNTVVAKGCAFQIDTFPLVWYEDDYGQAILDSIPFPKSKIQELSNYVQPFGYTVNLKPNNNLRLVSFDHTDTLYMEIYLRPLFSDSIAIRSVRYFIEAAVPLPHKIECFLDDYFQRYEAMSELE